MVFVNELVSSLILAVVQGITEWFPISSDGHLVLFERILDYQGGLFFDVALHLGTLLAVVIYFSKDVVEIIRELFSGRVKSNQGKLGLLIALATVPAALVGYFFRDVFEFAFSSLGVAAFGFAVSGIFLVIASLKKRREGKLNYLEALIIGFAQIFALFPGLSRSGSTIGMGMLLGLKDKEAIKFSFLIAIPIILGANILVLGNTRLSSELFLPVFVSFVVGIIAIHLLYGKAFVTRNNLRWYGLYALVLGIALGVWVLLG